MRRFSIFAASNPVSPIGPGVLMMISVKLLALDVIEDLQDRREAELLQLVFGQLEFADRPEILDRNSVDASARRAT